VKFATLGRRGATSELLAADIDELAAVRVAAARRCKSWDEVPDDLVRRPRGMLVSTSSDKVYRRYAGATFGRGGRIEFAEQTPLEFVVRDVGLPNAYVQAKAGHSQFTVTERYVHAAQVAFPGAADRSEERLFGEVGARQLRHEGGEETSRKLNEQPSRVEKGSSRVEKSSWS
jgi:hypothetical protein